MLLSSLWKPIRMPEHLTSGAWTWPKLAGTRNQQGPKFLISDDISVHDCRWKNCSFPSPWRPLMLTFTSPLFMLIREKKIAFFISNLMCPNEKKLEGCKLFPHVPGILRFPSLYSSTFMLNINWCSSYKPFQMMWPLFPVRSVSHWYGE